MPFDLDHWLAGSVQPTDAAPGGGIPIVQAGAGVLRQRAAEIPPSLLGSRSLARLADIMVEAMRTAPGVGLAAPQIGVPLRIFVAEDDAERMAQQPAEALAVRGRVPLPLLVLVNPTVTPAGDGAATFYEGCLSVRGYGALVARAAAVDVAGVDLHGRPLALRLEGWPARIMQHEMDHLNGTLYVDRMIARSFAAADDLPRRASMPVDQVMDELVAEREAP
jgi:peptide deformylase